MGGLGTGFSRYVLVQGKNQKGGSSDGPAGVAQGSLDPPPPPEEPKPPPPPPPEKPPPPSPREALVTFAVAYRSEGPISSTSSSMTVRFSPSLVSNERCFSRPLTMTREPRVRDSATFSATCRHTLQRRNSASPSFHSCDWRSKVRGVEATVKLATAAPEGVKRSSGSAVRLPTTVMTVSPAMVSGPRGASASCAGPTRSG